MTFKKYQNLFVGLFFLAFSLAYASQIFAIKITKVALIDSAFYPKILAAALLFLSVFQISVSFWDMKKGKAVEENKEKKDYRTVVLTLLLSLAYVVILEPVGFLISSAIYMFCQMMVMCPNDELKPVKFVIISIASSLVIYFVFRNGLSLMLPAGILTGLF